MRSRLMGVLIAAALLLPYGRAAAAEGEGRESPAKERTESRAKKQAEEQKALGAYSKAVTQYGQDSDQANEAWKKVIGEFQEHGDNPPSRPIQAAPIMP